jgi:hypothetical protein
VSIAASGEVKGRHMARALLGYVGNSSDQVLAMEVARLRRRVAELETELAELRATDHAVMDIELHQIAEVAAPALA